LWGSPVVREAVAGATFAFGVASFFQINAATLELIAQRLVERLAGARRIVDLYCGVGTFSIILGMRGVSSSGVESYAPAVGEAAANAAENGVTNASFEHASVADALAGERGASLVAGADAVVLDPPRKGCEPEVLAALFSNKVPRVLYLSCNPATLARDAKALAASGYRLERVTPFDMFPHTGHVEALAEFAL
jgi:23S rRNA (uracil1939-C5)-methyltransferase